MKNYEFYTYELNKDNITWASCEKKDNHYLQLGSRTFAYTLKGINMLNLQKQMNKELSKVQGRVYFRRDIGNFFKTKYSQAGVDISLGNKIVREIQPLIRETENSSVLSEAGGFNGMVQLGDKILVSSMDGVGTKSIFSQSIDCLPI